MSHSRSKKSRKKNPVPGIVLSLLLLVAAGIFLCLLYLTHMLTNTYLFVAAGACLIAVLITFYLTRNFRKRIPFVFGSLWFLLCIGIFSVGSIYLYRTQAALQAIAGTETEISNVSVYVRIDDPAQTLSDASGYSFGILSTLDRENTDTVVSRINEQLGATILMVTHDAFTASYAGRILFLQDGKIFTELNKGSDSRSAFFEKILHVLTLLGGGESHVC